MSRHRKLQQKPKVNKMKNIKEQSEQLAQKQSWLRKGVREWLESWKHATADELDNTNIEYLELITIHDPMGPFDAYYLRRGDDEIYKVDGETYNFTGFDGYSIVADHLDIKQLRKIMSNLPEQLDGYASRLESENQRVDKLRKMLGNLM